MTRLRTLVAALALSACATTSPAVLANLDRVERQHDELAAAVEDERPRLAPAFDEASRRLDPALDHPGCSTAPATSGSPVRFTAGGRTFRVSVQPGACRTVSP